MRRALSPQLERMMTKRPLQEKPTFKVVSDRMRGDDRRGHGTRYQPELDLLMAGQTLQTPWKATAASAVVGGLLRTRGYKLHTHATPEGTVLWAERIIDCDGN